MPNEHEGPTGQFTNSDPIGANNPLDELITGVDAAGRRWKQMLVDLAQIQREGQEKDPFRVNRWLEKVQLLWR